MHRNLAEIARVVPEIPVGLTDRQTYTHTYTHRDATDAILITKLRHRSRGMK